MFLKAFFKGMGGVFLVLFLYCPAQSQLIDIGKFKAVQIPYNLSYQDVVIEKGFYDLEALKNPTTPSCYLRFKKGKQVVCLVEGERLDYEGYGADRLTDPSIPDKPTLKFKRNAEEKKLLITVETGKVARRFPLLKLRFTLRCEE